MWDGQNLLLEQDETLAARLHYLSRPDAAGEVLGQRQVGSGTEPTRAFFYGHDLSGNTRQVIGVGGSFVRGYLYNAFGEVLAESQGAGTVGPGGQVTGSGFVNERNPIRFGGEVGYYTDANDRLYVRARHYKPSVGRWISEDPIGFAGGDQNLYGYVGNRVPNWTDSSGLKDIGDPRYETPEERRRRESSEARFRSETPEQRRRRHKAEEPMILAGGVWSSVSEGDIFNRITNFSAGAGDELSFGLTDLNRGLWGLNRGVVNKGTSAYFFGHYAGVALSVFTGGLEVKAAIRAYKATRVAQIAVAAEAPTALARRRVVITRSAPLTGPIKKVVWQTGKGGVVKGKNIPAKAGWLHVVGEHYGQKAAKSVFTIDKMQLRRLLKSRSVTQAPIEAVRQFPGGVSYLRTVNLKRIVGIVDASDRTRVKALNYTTWVAVWTDGAGHLITAYAVPGRTIGSVIGSKLARRGGR